MLLTQAEYIIRTNVIRKKKLQFKVNWLMKNVLYEMLIVSVKAFCNGLIIKHNLIYR